MWQICHRVWSFERTSYKLELVLVARVEQTGWAGAYPSRGWRGTLGGTRSLGDRPCVTGGGMWSTLPRNRRRMAKGAMGRPRPGPSIAYGTLARRLLGEQDECHTANAFVFYDLAFRSLVALRPVIANRCASLPVSINRALTDKRLETALTH